MHDLFNTHDFLRNQWFLQPRLCINCLLSVTSWLQGMVELSLNKNKNKGWKSRFYFSGRTKSSSHVCTEVSRISWFCGHVSELVLGSLSKMYREQETKKLQSIKWMDFYFQCKDQIDLYRFKKFETKKASGFLKLCCNIACILHGGQSTNPIPWRYQPPLCVGCTKLWYQFNWCIK